MEFGLGLGMAILIDALVERLVVVPAVMQVLGRRAWYMPRWLDRVLPPLTVEPPAAPAPPDRDPVPVGAIPAAAEGDG
jgi:putative drug exporter of the RND superfamily